jgi:transposase
MLNLGSAALRVFLAVQPCDMRKSFNGLHAAACQQLGDGRLGTDMPFVFSNKRRDRIRLLHFDGSGLWVAAKRLEKGTFSWPTAGQGQARLRLRPEALQLLLDGVDLRGATLRPWYEVPRAWAKPPSSETARLPSDEGLLGYAPDGEDLEALAKRLVVQGGRLEAELAAARHEIARKDQIIAALQHRLFGSKSERYHPDQEQLDFGEEVLGMGAKRT